jgi:hypothetical protein
MLNQSYFISATRHSTFGKHNVNFLLEIMSDLVLTVQPSVRYYDSLAKQKLVKSEI